MNSIYYFQFVPDNSFNFRFLTGNLPGKSVFLRPKSKKINENRCFNPAGGTRKPTS